MTTHAIFIGGTSSNAGKSWMATAICAWLRRRGVSVAPFKAQNMSNNSYPCRDGGEIGRAQVAQAEACALEPERAMNPILLKPNGDGTSQVVVNGHVWKTLPAREYYEHFDVLLAEVIRAYQDLAQRFDVIVIEGAGSVSEVNLRPCDLVNLGLVTRLDVPWVLVADIERGGVFGSIVGTMALLSSEERRLFRGFLVNKFRGDRSLFDSGVEMLESKTGAPCLGVFPYAEHLRLDAEDSLALDAHPRAPVPPGTRTAIIRFPCLSNSTDFRLLTWADWLTQPATLSYDFIVLPGSKHTIADLEWMRRQRLDSWIVDQHARGATVIGICGGFQMLGTTIADPHNAESPQPFAAGLGLLPLETTLDHAKTIRRRHATTPGGTSFEAYEIHLGVSRIHQGLSPFATLEDGSPEGVRGERVVGTYLHGALEHPDVCAELFHTPIEGIISKASEYDRLADWFDRYSRRPDSWLL